MRWRMVCGSSRRFTSNGCHEWQISRSGPQPAKRRSGRLAPSRAPIGRTAGGAIEELIDADPVAARVREIMADRRTWTGLLPIFCTPPPMDGVMARRTRVAVGQKMPGQLRAASVVHRLFSGP